MAYQYNQGLSLGFFNRTAEIAKRPRPEQIDLWRCWKTDTVTPDAYFPKVAGVMTYC